MKKGLVHIYTGDGKGKTTAALGLALRGVGCGLHVNMIQFLKTWDTGEARCAQRLGDNFKIWQFESKHGFFNELTDEEKSVLQGEVDRAMAFAAECAADGKTDILILDEILGTLAMGLVTQEQILALMQKKSEGTEMVLTGRDAPEKLICAADYVSEVKMIKHPYQKGMAARQGIEF